MGKGGNLVQHYLFLVSVIPDVLTPDEMNF
ncbi:hypothetical protein CBM2634_P80009 [Cupriavidus taiwanensis]|uniref:Uncharacterized protein n=1 Tax=Cupriavidus taiwanensis TaxID=164546 RepID=A0A375JB03_9BURK|nr:hypothetical protein CBM2634_P80009 [Cupriavidus taiwanensis]